jgi:hypothetical protein
MFEDDERSFGGPMFMLQAMAPTMTMIILVSGLVWFALVAYLVARWRDHRSPSPDPQLGLKFSLHFFRLVSFQTLMLGTVLLMFSMLGKNLGEGREYIYRPAFGLLVPSGAVFGVVSVMLGKTNNESHPIVSRMFGGLNLLFTGTLGFTTLIFAFVVLFQKGEAGQSGRIAWSGLLVYTTAWAALAAMFSRQVLDAPPPPTTYPPAGPAGGDDRPSPMQRPLA